ncbi:MAG: hypothetical protein V4550_19400 [Gemmatimonadota bacterium]
MAMMVTIRRPDGAHATVMYSRHGDDTLTIIDVPSTGIGIGIGTKPGIYDYRVITAGYEDWIDVNRVVKARPCNDLPPQSQIYMQPRK